MKMWATAIGLGIVFLSSANGYGQNAGGTKTSTKAAVPATAKAETPTPKKNAKPDGSEGPAAPVVDEKRAAEVEAIRKADVSYLAAFDKGDAKSVAEHYTEDAEYVDEHGRLYQGRTAIEESLKAFFKECPECKLTLQIDSIRIIGPGVAVEDGVNSIIATKDSEPVVSRYTVIHVKHGSKWLAASVRDFSLKPRREHSARLKQLEWMLGDWVHEGKDAVVEFSSTLVDNGNFLLRNFTIRIAGQEAMSGSQRTGWTCAGGKLRCWIFDSDGGHSDGYWHRDGDTWVLKVTGITADGQAASSTSNYTFVNAHTMTFQSVDHEVAGVEFPDSAKVKIVKRSPRPE